MAETMPPGLPCSSTGSVSWSLPGRARFQIASLPLRPPMILQCKRSHASAKRMVQMFATKTCNSAEGSQPTVHNLGGSKCCDMM